MLSLHSLASQVLRNIGHCVYSVRARARARVCKYNNIRGRFITRPIPPLKLNGSFDLARGRHYLHISMKIGFFPIRA